MVPGLTSNEYQPIAKPSTLPASVVRHQRTKMKNFNKQTFINATIIWGILMIPIFLATWAAEEGTIGTSPIWLFLSKLSFLFRFPLLTIFGNLLDNLGGGYFLFLIFINTMFYGLLIERLTTLLFTKRQTT